MVKLLKFQFLLINLRNKIKLSLNKHQNQFLKVIILGELKKIILMFRGNQLNPIKLVIFEKKISLFNIKIL